MKGILFVILSQSLLIVICSADQVDFQTSFNEKNCTEYMKSSIEHKFQACRYRAAYNPGLLTDVPMETVKEKICQMYNILKTDCISYLQTCYSADYVTDRIQHIVLQESDRHLENTPAATIMQRCEDSPVVYQPPTEDPELYYETTTETTPETTFETTAEPDYLTTTSTELPTFTEKEEGERPTTNPGFTTTTDSTTTEQKPEHTSVANNTTTDTTAIRCSKPEQTQVFNCSKYFCDKFFQSRFVVQQYESQSKSSDRVQLILLSGVSILHVASLQNHPQISVSRSVFFFIDQSKEDTLTSLVGGIEEIISPSSKLDFSHKELLDTLGEALPCSCYSELVVQIIFTVSKEPNDFARLQLSTASTATVSLPLVSAFLASHLYTVLA